jgi:Fe-S-cluster containining protein
MKKVLELDKAAEILPDCPAGDFSLWLEHTRDALISNSGVDVDCGECKACCSSSYFIHISPEETGVLSRIDRRILFPAPGLAKGNVLLGYREDGSCPMMNGGTCSIYEHRPLTCRNYDCRIFAAAGIDAGGVEKMNITARVRRWMFSFPGEKDRAEFGAVQSAAAFIREHSGCFPSGVAPKNPSLLAVMAIKVYGVFMIPDGDDESRTVSETVSAVILESDRFEKMKDQI